MNRVYNLLFLLFLLVSVACSPRAGTSTSDSGKVRVVEDLSIYRPKYASSEAGTTVARAEPGNHVNNRVAVLMDTVASVNRGIKYAQGYRILAYNGSERETVMNLRKSIIRRVPGEQEYLTYQQPNFRLKIGDYFSRMEAQQVLNQLRDLIPNAQIVQEEINIPKK